MIYSFKVATTLAANRIVTATTGTAMMVKYPDTCTSLPIGITIDTVKDTTMAIPVKLVGEIAELTFADTCVSGELVRADHGAGDGRGFPFALALTSTAISNASAYVGVLLDTKVDLSGTVAKVLINPGYDRVTA